MLVNLNIMPKTEGRYYTVPNLTSAIRMLVEDLRENWNELRQDLVDFGKADFSQFEPIIGHLTILSPTTDVAVDGFYDDLIAIELADILKEENGLFLTKGRIRTSLLRRGVFEKDTGRDYPIRLDGDASELADALNNRDLSDVKLIVHDRVGSLDIMMGDSLIEDLIISSRFWRMSTRGDNRDIVLPKDGVVYITITRCAISSTRYNSYLTTAEHIEPPKTSPAEDPRIHVGPVLSDSGALEAMEHIAQAVTEATATARKTPDALSHGVPVIHRLALDRHIEANVRLRSQFIHGHVVGGPAYDYVMELYNQTVAEVSSTLIGLLDTIERSHGELTLAAIHAGGSLSAERIKKIVLLLAVGTELPSVLSLRFKHKEVEYSYDICFTMIDGLKSTADVTSIFVKLHKGGLGHDGVNRETYDLSSWQEVVPSQAPRACVVRVCRNPDQPLPYSDAPLIIDEIGRASCRERV